MAKTEKQFIFFVGLLKAASTYLRRELLPKCDPAMVYHDQQTFDEAVEIITNGDFSEKNVAKCKRIFSEKFENISQETIALVKPSVAGDPLKIENSFETFTERADFLHKVVPHAKIVFIVRNQTDFIISLYRQSIREGKAISFNKFTNYKKGTFLPRIKGDYETLDTLHLDFCFMANYYEEKFGEKNVHILFLEDLENNPENFISSVQHILDCEFTERVKPSKINVGLSALALNLMLLKNKYSFFQKDRGERNQVKFLDRVIAYLEKYDQKNISLKKTLAVSSPINLPAIILRRILIRSRIFLVFERFMQLAFNKVFYIDWDLMGEQKRSLLAKHYSKLNQGLSRHFRDPETAKYYIPKSSESSRPQA